MWYLGVIVFLFFVVISSGVLGFAGERVLLKDVQTLTLRRDRYTTGRRSASIPQLKCTGGSAGCYDFTPDTVQCYNRGHDGSDVQWECKCDMPRSVRFGTIEVVCEGYDYPTDPYILRGSCGLEYTLEKSSDGGGSGGFFWRRSQSEENYGKARSLKFSDLIFFLFVGLLIYALYRACVVPSGAASAGGHSSWWPGGGGSPRPPPGPGFRPEYFPPGGDSCHPSATQSSFGGFGGFWSGLGAGGLLGYLFGRNRDSYFPRNRLYPDVASYAGSSSFVNPDVAGPSTSSSSTRTAKGE